MNAPTGLTGSRHFIAEAVHDHVAPMVGSCIFFVLRYAWNGKETEMHVAHPQERLRDTADEHPERQFGTPILRRKNRRANRMFPTAVVICLADAREPTALEIDMVAARIWHDVQPGFKQQWGDVAPGSRTHRRMIAAARAALGLFRPRLQGIGANIGDQRHLDHRLAPPGLLH
ncbi:hypothetical protein [Sphingosinicella rhizophila]|uniref:Uncharacterized protein n=1 Tax=Sphingosinicella rhizophila TaxID=3050082 RepID=A0ABU3QBQ8_9SPHN|nr:hypothetical protein [Sphingosinicella sp. GR2756]MDT9600834.1 hypothetical protein [Sphingosinicella sp. GR2756]